MNRVQAALIYTPVPDAATARDIAATLIEEKLIACANILGPVEAIFAWKGEIESAAENGVLFKTTADKLDLAVARIGALHPYETPAIIGTICDAAHAATLDWLEKQTA